MVTRFNDKIIVYEDIFPQDVRVSVNGRRIAKGLDSRIPDDPRTLTETTDARINHGRWIVECPGGCTDAVLASSIYPVFVCSMEFCSSNAYIRVIFPVDRNAIEAELLKRPVHSSGMPIHSNWSIGETLKNLQDELSILDNLPRPAKD